MPKPLYFMVAVEEIATGSVLRKWHETPGIVSFVPAFDTEGGLGAGRKQLEQAAAEKRTTSIDHTKMVIKMLLQGPRSIREISDAIGGKITRAYGLMSKLHKDGLTESAGKGLHQLTTRARSQINAQFNDAVPALAAPAKIKRGPAGRAAPGSGPIILRAVLDAGPVHPSDLRKQLAHKGMSTKSISGVLDRGKRQGLIKQNGSQLYELTAKGMKIELGAHANG